jgi:ATP phosphoribosyltransferase
MERLKIAVQKKGRLSEKSLALITSSGISLKNGLGQLVSEAANFPLDILYLRDDDIPEYVRDGVADIGIVGENEYLESRNQLTVVKRLGFSKCRLCMAIPKSEKYTDLTYFNDKKIATSYPNILETFFKEKGIRAEVHKISGSVEIAPGIGLADAIFDIVSTGSTLLMNGLKEVDEVMKSEALLLATPELSASKQALLDELVFRIETVQRAKKNKYILLNAPNDKLDEIESILPGMKSPTVMPLAEEGWSSVHSVVEEDRFWEVIGKLKELGAEGILVCPIEKMIV